MTQRDDAKLPGGEPRVPITMVVGSVVALVGFSPWYVFFVRNGENLGALLITLLVAVALNGFFDWLQKRLHRPRWLGWLMRLSNLVMVTAGVHLTGGVVGNPFVLGFASFLVVAAFRRGKVGAWHGIALVALAFVLLSAYWLRPLATHDVVWAIAAFGLVAIVGVAAGQLAQARIDAEASRRESEQRYRTLFHSSPDPVVLTGREPLEIMEVNDIFCITFSLSRADVEKKLLTEIGLFVSDPKAVSDAEVELRTGDGEERTGAVTTVGLTLNGRPCTFWVIRDVTERKALEAKVAQGQRLEALGTLAAGVAHDFNNILTATMGHASVLAAALPEGSENRYDAEQIVVSAQRAADLTEQLRAFAWREEEESREPLDLNALAEEVILLAGRGMMGSVSFETKLSKGLPYVEGHAGQLHQVLLNLCINGRDAMEKGGTLTITTRLAQQGEVKSAGKKRDAHRGFVAIEVKDTGVGMPNSVLERIFEPFFSTKSLGRGIGLSSAYGIVTRLGGSVQVRSEVGKGSTFVVFLPISQNAPSSPVHQSPPTHTRGDTILVVDDEKSLRKLARRVLTDAGYEVLLARDSTEAVNTFEKHNGSIDLVFLDLVLPGATSGRELVADIKRRNSHIRFLLTSGSRAQEEWATPRHPFIRKPFDSGRLLESVATVLRDR